MTLGDTLHVKDLPIFTDANISVTTDPEAIVATVAAIHNGPLPDDDAEADGEEAKTE